MEQAWAKEELDYSESALEDSSPVFATELCYCNEAGGWYDGRLA